MAKEQTLEIQFIKWSYKQVIFLFSSSVNNHSLICGFLEEVKTEPSSFFTYTYVLSYTIDIRVYAVALFPFGEFEFNGGDKGKVY